MIEMDIPKPGTLRFRTSPEAMYKIPSQVFPLNGPLEIFATGNTQDCTDPVIIEAFNSVQPQLGCCYQNTEDFVKAAIAAGVPKSDLATYVGWIFIGGEMPVHHCFAVYKGVSVFDFATDAKMEFVKTLKNATREEALAAIMELHRTNSTKTNAERYGTGKVDAYYMYAASRCSPSEGRKIFNRLKKAQPNHPAYRNMKLDAKGYSDTQRKILAVQESAAK